MALRRFAFTVHDIPRPWARPRVSRQGHFYTVKKDQDVRFNIRAAFLSLPEVTQAIWNKEGAVALIGPLRLTVTAFLAMPKSIPKKLRATALPAVRPDLDNYIKQVEDALQNYAFRDDAQIVTIEARKRYGEPPRWEIILDEIENS